MSFDWSDFLALAIDLRNMGVSQPREEARLRTAISRAYYGVFCRAREHLLVKYPTIPIPRGGEAHGEVRDRFDSDLRPTSQAVATHLERLRTWRNMADYDNTVPGLPALAEMVIQTAEAAMAALDML